MITFTLKKYLFVMLCNIVETTFKRCEARNKGCKRCNMEDSCMLIELVKELKRFN